jgi:hypothetical protein
MEVANTVQASELAPLRSLASEFLAADSVEIAVLDRIASLAAELAARCREQARQQVLDLVEARALPLLPAAVDDLRARLAPMSVDRLSALAALLDRAVTARAAFEEADSGLMAARRKGDYAAMAPLALTADAQKNELETATVEFAQQLGLADALPEEPVATEEAAPSAAAASAEASGLAITAEAAVAPPTEARAAEDMAPATEAAVASEPLQTAPAEPEPAEAQPERRRLRALIRQMRPASEEVPAR